MPDPIHSLLCAVLISLPFSLQEESSSQDEVVQGTTAVLCPDRVGVAIAGQSVLKEVSLAGKITRSLSLPFTPKWPVLGRSGAEDWLVIDGAKTGPGWRIQGDGEPNSRFAISESLGARCIRSSGDTVGVLYGYEFQDFNESDRGLTVVLPDGTGFKHIAYSEEDDNLLYGPSDFDFSGDGGLVVLDRSLAKLQLFDEQFEPAGTVSIDQLEEDLLPIIQVSGTAVTLYQKRDGELRVLSLVVDHSSLTYELKLNTSFVLPARWKESLIEDALALEGDRLLFRTPLEVVILEGRDAEGLVLVSLGRR